MVQWVKNPTLVNMVAVEAQVRSLAQSSGLKDPAVAVPQLRLRLQLGLRFNPWPGNFHMLQVQP